MYVELYIVLILSLDHDLDAKPVVAVPTGCYHILGPTASAAGSTGTESCPALFEFTIPIGSMSDLRPCFDSVVSEFKYVIAILILARLGSASVLAHLPGYKTSPWEL